MSLGGRITAAYPALRRPAFARDITAQTLSGFGTWFQLIAQSLLVLDLTRSGRALGLMAAAQFLPTTLLSPYAGVIGDRLQARRVMLAVNVWACGVAIAFWALTAAGVVNRVWIWVLAGLFGLGTTFERAVQGALLAELVPAEGRANASALANVSNSSGRLVGPAVAGLLYAWRGPAICFLLNAFSYLIVIVALARIRPSELLDRPRKDTGGALSELRSGIAYVRRTPALQAPLVWNAIVGVFAFNFFSVMPAMITFVYDSGATALGVTEALNAGAAVVGGLWIARRIEPSRHRLMLSSWGFAIGLAGSAVMPNLFTYFLWMPLFGLSFIYWITAMSALLQVETEPAYLGRVMSLYSLGVFGSTPIGSTIAGWMIDAWSARAAMGMGAVSMLAMAVWFSVFRNPGAASGTGG